MSQLAVVHLESSHDAFDQDDCKSISGQNREDETEEASATGTLRTETQSASLFRQLSKEHERLYANN